MTTDTLLEQIMQSSGNIVLWLILGCSLLAVFIILEKLFHFHRARIHVEEFLHGLFNVLRRNNAAEAVAICDDTPGPVARILRAAVLNCDKDEHEIKQATQEARLEEVPRLERHLKGLATVAHLTPLLGLLGTVMGMVGAFDAMEAAGPLVTTRDLSHDIKLALFTTAAGLTVAIPCYGFYNFLVGRVEEIICDMEKGANEIVYFLSHHQVDLPPKAAEDITLQQEGDGTYAETQ